MDVLDVKMETIGAVGAQRLRRQDARIADVDRLRGEVKKFFKFTGFDWSQRYDARYVCAYARQRGWVQSRINKAIETLDLQYRIAVNRQILKNEAKNV